jgi:hypothetical protein
MAMVSVRGEEVIIRAETSERRHAGGLLADVEMVMAAKHAFVVQRHETFFEMANDEHAPA